jgi:two-component sensor histidine kinase
VLEAIQRLLLTEIDHRAMNAFAQVQSIISMTPKDKVAYYLSTVRRRIDRLRSGRLGSVGRDH